MRKIKKIFVVLGCLLSGVLLTGFDWVLFPIEVKTDFEAIGPFEQYSNDYKVKGTIRINRNISFRDKITINEIGKSPIFFNLSEVHYIFMDNAANITFKLPLRDMLSNNGIHVKYESIDDNNKPFHSFEFNLKPIMHKEINVKEHLSNPFVIEDIVVDPDDYNDNNTEKILFDGFVDYFNENYYYRLDLDDLFLTYSCLKEYQDDDGYLEFYDHYKIFPFLDNDDQVSRFQIPVKSSQNNSKICFKFAKTMYVNPKTLDMSFIQFDNFVPTKYFYLPINKLDLLLDQTFTLKFDSFGYGKSSFSWDIKYLNNHYLIGNCDNSDYCVKGEIF